MSFSIQTNVSSLAAQENLRVNGEFQGRTISRLTSGYRINSSGDDAAGLAVANKYRSETAELAQGVRNANDGISSMQIIDGGLNNISKMLDRLKTLATQAASNTFTGERSTLDDEYQALLGEIDRQAANIGLGTGGTAEANKFNKAISVYTGGGSEQSNAKVEIDLSASSNKVDAAGLGLSGSAVNGSARATIIGGDDLSSETGLLAGGQTQKFTLWVEGGNKVEFTLTGDSDGMSGQEVVNAINQRVSAYGVSASLYTGATAADTGKLQLASSKGFTFKAEAASDNTAGVRVTAAVEKANQGLYNMEIDVITAVNAQTLTFGVDGVNDSDTYLTVNATAQDTLGAAVASHINTNIAGLSAFYDDATDKLFVTGSAEFTISSTAGAAAAGLDVTGGVAGEDLTHGGATTEVATATGPTGDTDVTVNALNAITKITDAVKALGTVQGKVGTAQNKLQYAIQLAQSQISNFSAAESRVRDADVAAEAANLTKAQVLQQASLAAMAQANSAPQAVMALLRG
jgi:flagellin